jgi:hypothetical protein
MFLSAYKKEKFAMNKSNKDKSYFEINGAGGGGRSIKIINRLNESESSRKKEALINNSNVNFSLDKFQNKTKKGIKFGLLEYKRINEIKNFDIYNSKNKNKNNFK